MNEMIRLEIQNKEPLLNFFLIEDCYLIPMFWILSVMSSGYALLQNEEEKTFSESQLPQIRRSIYDVFSSAQFPRTFISILTEKQAGRWLGH